MFLNKERKMVDEKHQLKRKKSSDVPEENREQIKRQKKAVKEKERPSMACRFDVFISFRGTDTRNGFTSHLHKELKTHGITAFIDSEDLQKGEKISVLFKHIKGSRIFMPVFSKNYAGSKWCLREITKMVEIYEREPERRPIIPIFYRVVPSNVKHCKGLFGKAFQDLQENNQLGEEEINKWRTALKAAGELSGYTLSKTENEAEIITCISKRVSDILCKVPFDIQPVGITLHPLKQMLKREKKGICMIGICGLGGIGKTTLAMALYNELSPKFEGSCFLSDIRSKSDDRDGLPTLQAELINEVLRRQETKKIANVEQGISLIKNSLRDKQVLLILDDVGHKNQLAAFTADRRKKEEWFGEGSKIIVTTRDEKVLLQHGLQKNCDIYFPKGLNREHSLQLFCHHAFVSDQPLEGFKELSLEVVEVAQGLPLALKVFGPLFGDLEEKKEWEDKLEILKRDQHLEVHERLKISYDSLDQKQQSVFLDIACFFIGHRKEYPVYMWEASGNFPNDTLKVLQHKSLIKFDSLERFEMHDQIRDMGRMIVKKEGNSDPLKYSRPWTKDQMSEVLTDAKVSQGNPYIQGIHFNEDSNEKIDWKVIEVMPSLRMITGAYGKLRGLEEDKEETIRLPRDIRWLEWKRCPYQTLTFSNNKHEKLGVLDLSKSDFRDFRSHRIEFPKLKILNLSDCHHLVRTPDFTNLLSLEGLRFDGCESLTQMDESIGQLEKLVHLSLWRCKKLKGLPAGLCKLSSLESLELSECQGISVLPTQIGDLTSLEHLGLERTSISNVPDSIGNLQSLENLNLAVCKRISVLPTQIGDLTSLKYLNLRRTSISDVPDSIGRLQNLEELNLSNCSSLKRMPDSIGDLKNLSQLYLNNCKFLEQLPNSMGMLPSLEELRIHHCTLLREVPDSLGDSDDHPISIEGCISLEKLPNFFPRRHNNGLIFDGFKSLRRLPNFLCEGFVDVLSLLDCELLEALPDNIGIGIWSSSLRILQLSGCTLVRIIPESIGNLKNLERLRLSDCQLLKELPECIGRLLTLKELDLSGWTSIKSIPEFIGNLERLKHLSLQGCQSLEKLPECTCRLLSLEELDLSGCTSLISIPESIGYLKGLKLLNLEECRSLKELPESLEGLIYLKVLHIYGGMSVKKVPNFIGKLTNLEQLYLKEIEEIPDSIGMLKSLKELHLSGFSPLNCQLPKSMEGLKSLSMLCICGGTSVNKVPVFQYSWSQNKMVLSELEEIPEVIAGFSEIEVIFIADCPKLESLPQLPSSCTRLWIQGCAAFRKLSGPSTINDLLELAELHLVECKAFADLSGLASLKSLKLLALADLNGLSRDLMDKLSQASFESLEHLLIWGASDGSDLLFGLPKSNVGKVWRLQGRCFLTEELPSYTLDINILIQVLVEGKVVTEVTCTARREEENNVFDEDDYAEGYYDDDDEDNDNDYIDELYDIEAHKRWRLEGRDFYNINYKEGEEIVKWVEEGNATLRVLTTYNHYRLRMAFLAVRYCE